MATVQASVGLLRNREPLIDISFDWLIDVGKPTAWPHEPLASENMIVLLYEQWKCACQSQYCVATAIV